MESPSIYLPMDRRQALAEGRDLPDHTQGAALFADISGFTPLTEALAHELGPRRGAEELTHWLNQVYDALVAELDRAGGSIVGFSGDAITCWFDGDTGLQAVACAFAMQQTMEQFSQLQSPAGRSFGLAMKVAVATGAVRRFLVGDPTIQLTDVLAGDLLVRMAAAEHQATKGEVVLSAETARALERQVVVSEWRAAPEIAGQVAVIERLTSPVEPAPWPPIAPDTLSNEQVRPWLLPPVYERLSTGQGEFLAELRPAVALFLRFSGINYDADPAAGEQLDAYIRWVQRILLRYEGSLIQITVGDKGSYFYAAFGAPVAHEDDAARAAAAALELRELPAELDFIGDIQIGISQGQMRAGAYGGVTRRTYGVLGDDVNLAARLMQHAAAGQILISQRVHLALGELWICEELPPVQVKGKAAPVIIFNLLTTSRQPALRLQRYALPLVGRAAELAAIQAQLDLALAGHGQIICITAEAGMGKSRLLAESVLHALARGFTGYGGDCQSYGTTTPYLVWQPVLHSFFGLDSGAAAEDYLALLAAQLQQVDPGLSARLPLLSPALNLPIPDNELTSSLDPKLRKVSLEALLVDCIRHRAQTTPLLLVLEDCHWIDGLSADVLAALGHAMTELPLVLLLAYRPHEASRHQALSITSLPHCTEIALTDFSLAEANELIQLKLAQFSDSQAHLPAQLVERITTRAQGNPFYIEELLNYLHDQGLDPRNRAALDQLELPASLHSLILGRIDQLSEHQKITLKVASILGRTFKTAWLWGYYPQIGSFEQVRADLEALSKLDLTPLDTPDPEQSYLFKHMVTQEVAYESLAYATRSTLHERFGAFLEVAYAPAIDQYIDLLAYHYGRSQNLIKQREYLRKAGAAAAAVYANPAAIEYYRRLLPLLAAVEQLSLMEELGNVLERIGEWASAEELYQQAMQLAERCNDALAGARYLRLYASLLLKQGRYAESLVAINQAQATLSAHGDSLGLAAALYSRGSIASAQGDYAQARRDFEAALELRRRSADGPLIALSLQGLASLAYYQGEYARSRSLMEESLSMQRELGAKPGIALALSGLASLGYIQGAYQQARAAARETLLLQREIGNKAGLAFALHALASLASAEGDFAEAQTLYRESLALQQELGAKSGMANSLLKLGELARSTGDYQQAAAYYNESLALCRELGDRSNIAWLLHNLGYIHHHQDDFRLAATLFAESLQLFQALEDKSGLASCLAGLGGIMGRSQQPERAQLTAVTLLGAVEALLETIGAPMDPADQADYDLNTTKLRGLLDSASFERAWQSGRQLSLEQALELGNRMEDKP